ncbi:MAG: UDP-N-acetylmuramate dehydrogenase [Bacilli bacterium]|nr:UDP-N-acetylmuramate dehydrogenase [Bacilli bacterium]
MDIIKDIKGLKVGKVIESPIMRNYTTYKVGGKAICIVIPNSVPDLIKLMNYIYTKKLKYKILGNGSNLIFNDSGYEGVLIKLSKFDKFEQFGNEFDIGAGVSTIKAAMKVSKEGYTGFEFATGIPGTIGGAIYMNAGAYNSDMGYITKSIKVLTPDLKVKTMYNHELEFHYRTSFLKTHPNYICLEAKIALKKGNKNVIMELINERRTRRIASQPLEFPSAGSVFRNPTGDYAGRLIESLGYKGKGIGGAIVSDKHANFIINSGNAKGEDIKELITKIQKEVKEKYNIELKVEQEFVE